MRVFVVWEPILLTDWSAPGTGVLARLADPRAAPFWDPGHRMARQMAADAHAPQPAEHCCRRGGVLWDLAAVYPVGARWTDTVPPAVFFDGPVVNRREEIGAAVRSLAANNR